MVKSDGVALCLFGGQVIIVTLHPGGGVLLHLVTAVRIDIQRKTGGSVAQQVLYALNICPRGKTYRNTLCISRGSIKNGFSNDCQRFVVHSNEIDPNFQLI